MTTENEQTNDKAWIEIRPDGPYLVHGGIPLVRKVQVVSEHGEPLTWRKEETLIAGEEYKLCRCGESSAWPFCDSTHRQIWFDGTETADTRTVAQRRVLVEGGVGIAVWKDHSLCTEAGFCGNRLATVVGMTPHTGESTIRAQVIAMIERCPSGSFMYSLRADQDDIEPDLPRQIAVTVEITSAGSIRGPFWVTGNVPIVRADGKPFETRNRVTLCSCGKSRNKPLCDGTHRREPVFMQE